MIIAVSLITMIYAFFVWRLLERISRLERRLEQIADAEKEKRDLLYNCVDDRFWEMQTKYAAEINRIWHYIKQQDKIPPEESKSFRRKV